MPWGVWKKDKVKEKEKEKAEEKDGKEGTNQAPFSGEAEQKHQLDETYQDQKQQADLEDNQEKGVRRDGKEEEEPREEREKNTIKTKDNNNKKEKAKKGAAEGRAVEKQEQKHKMDSPSVLPQASPDGVANAKGNAGHHSRSRTPKTSRPTSPSPPPRREDLKASFENFERSWQRKQQDDDDESEEDSDEDSGEDTEEDSSEDEDKDDEWPASLCCSLCEQPFQEPLPPSKLSVSITLEQEERPDPSFMHIPKLLPQCLHVFCQSCLEDLLQRAIAAEHTSGGGAGRVVRKEDDGDEAAEAETGTDYDDTYAHLSCAKCHQVSRVGIERGIGGLATDHFMTSEIRMWQARQVNQECALCDDEGTPAKYRCVDCGYALCGLHRRAHGRGKGTATHEVLDLKEYRVRLKAGERLGRWNVEDGAAEVGLMATKEGGGEGGRAAARERQQQTAMRRKRRAAPVARGGAGGGGGPDLNRRRSSWELSALGTGARAGGDTAAGRPEAGGGAARGASVMPVACDEHPMQEAKLYCVTCRQLACHDCCAVGRHRAGQRPRPRQGQGQGQRQTHKQHHDVRHHDVRLAAECEEWLRASLLADMGDGQAGLRVVGRAARGVEERLQDVELKETALCKQVKASFGSLRAALDQQEGLLLGRVKKASESKIHALEEQLEGMESLEERLSTAISRSEEVLLGRVAPTVSTDRSEVVLQVAGQEFIDMHCAFEGALRELKESVGVLECQPVEEDDLNFYCDERYMEAMTRQVDKVGALFDSQDRNGLRGSSLAKAAEATGDSDWRRKKGGKSSKSNSKREDQEEEEEEEEGRKDFEQRGVHFTLQQLRDRGRRGLYADADDIVIEVRRGSDGQSLSVSDGAAPSSGSTGTATRGGKQQQQLVIQRQQQDELLGWVHLRVRLEGSKGRAFSEEQHFEAIPAGDLPAVRCTKHLTLL